MTGVITMAAPEVADVAEEVELLCHDCEARHLAQVKPTLRHQVACMIKNVTKKVSHSTCL
jgi:hypothetical protein